MEKLTEKLAEFCENIKFDKLPKNVEPAYDGLSINF